VKGGIGLIAESSHRDSSHQLPTPQPDDFPEKTWRKFLHSPTVGFAIIDEQLRYCAINDALAAMNGFETDAHLDKTILELLGPEAAAEFEPLIRQVFIAGESILDREWLTRLPTRETAGRWMVSYFPIRDAHGKVKQVGVVIVEVTDTSGLDREAKDVRRRYDALLQVADLVAQHGSLPELLPKLANQLHPEVPFEIANVAFHDPARDVMQVNLWEKGQKLPESTEVPVEEAVCRLAWESQQPVVWPDLEHEGRFEKSIHLLRRKGVRSYCSLPLTTAQKRLGTFGVGSSRPNAYGDADVRFLREVAELVALALENGMTRAALMEEKDRLEKLLEVSTTLMSNLEVEELFPAISSLVRKVVGQDYASVGLYEGRGQVLHLYALDSPLAKELIETVVPVAGSAQGAALSTGQTQVWNQVQLAALATPMTQRMLAMGIRSFCSIPLMTRKGVLGTLNLGSTKDGAFRGEDVSFLKQVAAQVAAALDSARAHGEVAVLTDKLAKEQLSLPDGRSTQGYESIVGESPALKRVLGEVNIVAPTEATVLILGETGTGKELVAQAIHRASSRKGSSFVKVNCSAIPTGLLESELFGHEKGAFTGAISQKIGRLELADKGTLFLDEIGDIPLELQPKLLRVLQEQEFERLGGVRTLRVDVRVIAATNRDLAKGVAAREFRSDLYYRLHVFPVHVPPLRERLEDVPLLVRYFVDKFSQRLKKKIETVPTEVMDVLMAWDWPGNVRELENLIERSMILSPGTILNVPLSELRLTPEAKSHDGTLQSMERDHIVRVLRETGGVISGSRGAAARLGMKRTTLQSRMSKLGISRADYGS
jgi:formate hydrogenlyase transcriptional activator